MNKNINSNNNINDMERNKSMKQNSIDFKGLYAVFHYQYFQIVNILIHHYRRTIGGLNPYALLCVPQYQLDMNEIDRKNERK